MKINTKVLEGCVKLKARNNHKLFHYRDIR
nr:hypothetical protein [Vaccinia virus]